MTQKLDAIRAKLRALRAKTVENGCTEEEAMAAAEKMAELLAKHGLSPEELDAEGYDRTKVPLGRRSPLDAVWVSVAAFADCKGYYERTWDRKLRWVFFGRPQDVLVAEYVYDVLKAACNRALSEFRASDVYKRRRTSKTRAQAVKAFQEGLAGSLCRKLHGGLWKRYWAGTNASTQALVTATENQLAEALVADGVKLGTARPLKDAMGKFKDAADNAGRLAGRSIDVQAGVGAAGSKVAGLLQ